MIRTGTKNKSALALAQEILNKVGGLKSLIRISKEELESSFKGIGKTKAITLIAVFELVKRFSKIDLKYEKVKIKGPEEVFNIFHSELSYLDVEKLFILALNSDNSVKKKIEISSGLLNSSLAAPREIFKVAVDVRAASIILIHNHPSGNPEPSKDDIEVTKKVVEAGKIFEIPVLDHIIIAGNTYTSFVERKLI